MYVSPLTAWFYTVEILQVLHRRSVWNSLSYAETQTGIPLKIAIIIIIIIIINKSAADDRKSEKAEAFLYRPPPPPFPFSPASLQHKEASTEDEA